MNMNFDHALLCLSVRPGAELNRNGFAPAYSLTAQQDIALRCKATIW